MRRAGRIENQTLEKWVLAVGAWWRGVGIGKGAEGMVEGWMTQEQAERLQARGRRCQELRRWMVANFVVARVRQR
jgi:hypothetical protein